MTADQIIVVAVLAYGIFIGYCLGRAHGYTRGANDFRDFYRR